MRWLLPILALCVGCKPDRIITAVGDLSFANERVDFDLTLVGYPTRTPFEIRNGGRFTRTGKLVTQPPFTLDTSDFEVAGGASLFVEATFAPTMAADFERPVSLESEGQSIAATLVGPAQMPPACSEHGPCWHLVYDHSVGDCVRVNAPDATACNGGTACLLTSQCSGGACVGTARSCEDNDKCTTDACDPDTGCVHFSATAQCGAAMNPCQSPACDPATGCTFVDVADGTSCGVSDCTSANICLLGKCTPVAVFDGAACGDPSPCQKSGLCSGSTCVRSAAWELSPSWTVWADPGKHVQWDSIADRFGNVYWREADADLSAGHLMSVTSTGFKRFSVPIPAVAQVALIEDLLILRMNTKLEARSISDGSLKWTRTFPLDPNVGSIFIRTLARGPTGVLYVGLFRMDKAEIPRLIDSSIVALKLSTGATLWDTRLPGVRIDDQSTPVDEAGYLYTGGAIGLKHRYFGLNPQGQIRWDIDNPHSNPAAVFGGRVYHWDHWLSETSTGAWVNSMPPTLFSAGYPRLALGAVSYVGTATASVPDCSDPGMDVMGTTMQLVRVDPATSQIAWTREISGRDAGGLEITNTILTSRATVLFSQPETYCRETQRSVLREISAQGDLSFTCSLPGTESYLGEGLLNDARWIVMVKDADAGVEGVRAVHLPGFELPAHGWSTAWGSPARDNHAR